MLNLTPINDRVIVAPDQEESRTLSGIYIPDEAQEKPQKGLVLAVGPGDVNERTGQRIDPQVIAGDVVYFGKYAGSEVPKMKYEGREIVVMKAEEILCRLPRDYEVEGVA